MVHIGSESIGRESALGGGGHMPIVYQSRNSINLSIVYAFTAHDPDTKNKEGYEIWEDDIEGIPNCKSDAWISSTN